jgi:hypothetical protein
LRDSQDWRKDVDDELEERFEVGGLIGMDVYVMDVEVDAGAGDYVGALQVYSSLEAALHGLDDWLMDMMIFVQEAHYDESSLVDAAGEVSFVGNDLLVSNGPWHGADLTWGINRHQVREV